MTSHRVFFRSTNQMLAVLHAYVIYLMYVMKLGDFFFLDFSWNPFPVVSTTAFEFSCKTTWRGEKAKTSSRLYVRLRDAISAAHTANCSSRHVDWMGKPAPRTVRCWILFWRMCDALNSHRSVLILCNVKKMSFSPTQYGKKWGGGAVLFAPSAGRKSVKCQMWGP